MGKSLSLYLTLGKPGDSIALGRLDDPPPELVETVARIILENLLNEARDFARRGETEVSQTKLKSGWLFRTTIENLLPGVSLDAKESLQGETEG